MLSVFIETRESQARLSSNTRYRTFPRFQRPRALIRLAFSKACSDFEILKKSSQCLVLELFYWVKLRTSIDT